MPTRAYFRPTAPGRRGVASATPAGWRHLAQMPSRRRKRLSREVDGLIAKGRPRCRHAKSRRGMTQSVSCPSSYPRHAREESAVASIFFLLGRSSLKHNTVIVRHSHLRHRIEATKHSSRSLDAFESFSTNKCKRTIGVISRRKASLWSLVACSRRCKSNKATSTPETDTSTKKTPIDCSVGCKNQSRTYLYVHKPDRHNRPCRRFILRGHLQTTRPLQAGYYLCTTAHRVPLSNAVQQQPILDPTGLDVAAGVQASTCESLPSLLHSERGVFGSFNLFALPWVYLAYQSSFARGNLLRLLISTEAVECSVPKPPNLIQVDMWKSRRSLQANMQH